jgi:hypothetical protein
MNNAKNPSGCTGVLMGLVFLAAVLNPNPVLAAPAEGVALAIVYDTSGSMLQKVRDLDGRLTPKQVIATRSLRAVLDRLEAVSTGPENSRITLQAGLIIFNGNQAEFAVNMGPFQAKQFRTWLAQQPPPRAGTPLGAALQLAGEAVLKSNLPRKHVLIITDGINTRGPDPSVTLPRLLSQAGRNHQLVAVHFIGLDVNAGEFAAVKKLGATVLGAADERQLNTQLEFILAKKILLEDEETPSAKPN